MISPDRDDFLLRLRESPRPQFADTLYRQLQATDCPAAPARLAAPLAHLALRYVAALALALGIAATLSPDARAGVMETIQRVRWIGGVTLIESNRGWDSAHQSPSRAGEPQSVAKIERVSLDEARKRVPYAFALPTWVPPGAAMTDSVEAVDGTSLIIYWATNGAHAFILRTYPPGGGTGLVGTESTQEVAVNGKPALLIRGIWDGATGQWSRPQFVTLHWSSGGTTYELLANTDVAASESDLLRIAESIP